MGISIWAFLYCTTAAYFTGNIAGQTIHDKSVMSSLVCVLMGVTWPVVLIVIVIQDVKRKMRKL